MTHCDRANQLARERGIQAHAPALVDLAETVAGIERWRVISLVREEFGMDSAKRLRDLLRGETSSQAGELVEVRG